MPMNMGGSVSAIGKDGKSGALLSITEHGGSVAAFGKDGKSWVRRSVSLNMGGVSHVEGKGEGKAGMGINEYGNGAVSTWDKNGYRLVIGVNNPKEGDTMFSREHWQIKLVYAGFGVTVTWLSGCCCHRHSAKG